MVGVLQVVAAVDTDIVADATVLVHDRIADITAMTDAYCRQAMRSGQVDLLDRLVIVHAHQVAADDGCPAADAGADAYDAVLDTRGVDDATLGDDGFFKGGAADLCGRQHPGARIDGLLVIE